MKEMNVDKTNMKDPMNTDDTLVISQTLSNSHKFLLKRNPKYVIFMENYSSKTHTLFSMKKST